MTNYQQKVNLLKKDPLEYAKYIKERKEYAKNYYHKNKKKYTKYRKRDWQNIKNNPYRHEKQIRAVHKWRATPNGIYTTLRTRNRKDFDLEKEEFIKWYTEQPKICQYCGLSLEQIRNLPYPYNRKNGIDRLSIDRKNNNIGYTISNIILCCFTCNTIKNNFLEYEEMKKVGELVLKPKFKKILSNN